MPIPVDLTQAGTAAIQDAVRKNKDYTVFLSPEQKQAIADSVFGPKPESEDDYTKAINAEKATFQQMLDQRRGTLEKEHTNATRMATFHSLGNALRTMVQPIGWAAGGATAGVQPYDNRQYIDAYNRAVRAGEEIRNLGNLDAQFQLDLARRETMRAQQQALADQKAQAQQDYAKQRHDYTMEEIEARGDQQKEVAEIRGKYKVTKNGTSVSDASLKTAYTQYYKYLEKFRSDMGQGYARQEGGAPLTFAQFLGTAAGGGYTVTPNETGQQPKGGSSPAPTKGKTGGFKGTGTTKAETKTEKKGGFKL